MRFPDSPFPRDAKDLLKLIALLHVGLVLFLLAKFTASGWLIALFAAFVSLTLGWLYWRERGSTN